MSWEEIPSNAGNTISDPQLMRPHLQVCPWVLAQAFALFWLHLPAQEKINPLSSSSQLRGWGPWSLGLQ